ncbi:DUF2283 domain-containing protein [Patescibacteria group bacterium]|nr:DUF2283 domain-containing protein [Patescibacteria group bacterium]
MRNKNKAKISYESEADVLIWEMTDKPIDFAKEIGNVVVHFTKNNIPVLIEILEASKFLTRAKNLVEKSGPAIRELTLAK